MDHHQNARLTVHGREQITKRVLRADVEAGRVQLQHQRKDGGQVDAAMCLKSGAPGGLFTPTMTFGALLGGLPGEGWSYLAPATRDGCASHIRAD